MASSRHMTGQFMVNNSATKDIAATNGDGNYLVIDDKKHISFNHYFNYCSFHIFLCEIN